MIGIAVVAGFLAMLWIVGRIGDAMPLRDRRQPALALFDVPPPPPPPPPLPEPHRLAIRIAPKHAVVGGGAGRHRQTPMPVVHDPSPTLFDRPAAPVATIEALPPPSGRNLLAGIGLGGMDGIGVGTGSGSGAGDGDGSGSGGARPLRYARATWVTPPGYEDFVREWPRPAPRLTTPAHVFLACAVKLDGRPYHCRTLAEGQPGHGYAAAAIRLTEHSRVRPVFLNGQRTEMPVIVPITFLPAQAPKHVAPDATPPSGSSAAGAASAATVP